MLANGSPLTTISGPRQLCKKKKRSVLYYYKGLWLDSAFSCGKLFHSGIVSREIRETFEHELGRSVINWINGRDVVFFLFFFSFFLFFFFLEQNVFKYFKIVIFYFSSYSLGTWLYTVSRHLQYDRTIIFTR